MQCKRTCHNRGADMADDSTPVPDVVEAGVKEYVVRLGPPVVDHQSRDYLGRPFGVAGVDEVGIRMVD